MTGVVAGRLVRNYSANFDGNLRRQVVIDVVQKARVSFIDHGVITVAELEADSRD